MADGRLGATKIGACVLLVGALGAWLLKLNRDCNYVLSARNGDIKAVQVYLNQGVRADGPHWQGITACEAAAANGRLAVVSLLLDHGADPNKGIFQAIRFDHADVVRAFVTHGANVRAPDVSEGESPLEVATKRGNADIVRILTANR